MEVSQMFVDAGISFPANQMENGEHRYRMMAPDGSGYIRTVAGSAGGWQNAHFHAGVMETYVVQSGWMGFVQGEDQGDGTMEVAVLRLSPGDVVTSEPLKQHNVYLPANAVIHTVKHGVEVPNPEKGSDWYPAHPAFDRWSKLFLEDDLTEDDGGTVIIHLT